MYKVVFKKYENYFDFAIISIFAALVFEIGVQIGRRPEKVAAQQTLGQQ